SSLSFDDKLNNEVDITMGTYQKSHPNKEVAEQWRQWIIEFIDVGWLKMNDIFYSLFKNQNVL
ncbi:8436_t:CDS:1, partial [Ambispora leptoticha]